MVCGREGVVVEGPLRARSSSVSPSRPAQKPSDIYINNTITNILMSIRTHTHTIACAYLHVCVGPAPHHQPYIHVKAHSKLIISARAITIVQPPGTKVVVLDFTYSLVAFQVDQCVRFYNGLCTNLTLSHRTPPSPTCVRFTSEVRPRSRYEL